MVQNLGTGLELGNVLQEVNLGGQGGVCWTDSWRIFQGRRNNLLIRHGQYDESIGLSGEVN